MASSHQGARGCLERCHPWKYIHLCRCASLATIHRASPPLVLKRPVKTNGSRSTCTRRASLRSTTVPRPISRHTAPGHRRIWCMCRRGRRSGIFPGNPGRCLQSNVSILPFNRVVLPIKDARQNRRSLWTTKAKERVEQARRSACKRASEARERRVQSVRDGRMRVEWSWDEHQMRRRSQPATDPSLWIESCDRPAAP